MVFLKSQIVLANHFFIMETEKLPVNIYISPNSDNNPETIKAIQKGIQEALEKFEGKGIVYFHIKNLHTGPVGKHHPCHDRENRPWHKFGHRRGKHHHGWHHFKGKHGHPHFKGNHHRWGNWWYHSGLEHENVRDGQAVIEEIPNTDAINEKDRNSKSSEEWCMLEYRSADDGENSENETSEVLRQQFDNMNVTKSV